jgi:hypothetical protein
VFLGYGDPFATLGSVNCYAIFDNVRVVRMSAPAVQPAITGISVAGNTVEIAFTAGSGDAASAFKLQHSGSPAAGFADDNSANIVATGSGQFKATTTTSGSMQFYRIKR